MRIINTDIFAGKELTIGILKAITDEELDCYECPNLSRKGCYKDCGTLARIKEICGVD